MRKFWIKAFASLLLAGAAPGNGAAPVEREAVERALAQLGDERWTARQAAEEALVEMGAEAAPVLEAALREVHDEDVRIRLESALRQIDRNRRLSPTLVTLHRDNAPAGEVLGEIEKLAGTRVLLDPPDVLNTRPARISIHADRAPFWSVMRQYCRATGLSPVRFGDLARLALARREDGWADSPAYGGSGLMPVLRGVSRGSPRSQDPQDLRLHIQVLVDPRLHVLLVPSEMDLVDAIDDREQSMLVPAPAGYLGRTSFGAPWSWDLQGVLRAPSKGATRIALIRGSATFAIVSRTETWEIEKIIAAGNLRRACPSGTFIVRELARRDADTWELRVAVDLRGVSEPRHEPVGEANALKSMLRLADGKGREFTAVSAATGGGHTDTSVAGYSVTFTRAGAGQAADGRPATLTWEVPAEISRVAAPFEFRDVPLPR